MPRFFISFVFCFSSLFALGSLNLNITLFLQDQLYFNTNTISTLDWNTRESIREGIKGGGVLTKGNEYNRRARIGELGGSGERDNLTVFVHGTWSNSSTFKKDFKEAVAKTLKDDNQKNFSWNAENSVEARKQAGKELAQMIKEEIKNLEDGEKVTIIAHSHGGNVVKYASQELSKGELDHVIFLATPHRNDAKLNQKAVKKGGKVVNVYDGRDLVQGFWGKSDVKSLNPFSEKFKFKDLHLFAPNPKQTMPNAINIKVKSEKIKIPNHLSPLEQDSYYNASKINNYLDSHSTIKDAEKWNQFVAPIFKGR